MYNISQISPVIDLPTAHGSFKALAFSMQNENKEHFALMKNAKNNPLIRIHSECLTGDVFKSLKCDCQQQLEDSIVKISKEENGIIIYLRQEGRDIGLINKMKAYQLQNKGYNTAEANIKIGCEQDARTYEAAIAILKYLNISEFRILTNNPCKLKALQAIWGNKVTRVPIVPIVTTHNKSYLETKVSIFKHLMNQEV